VTSADVADVINLRGLGWSIGKIARTLAMRRDDVCAALAADDAGRRDDPEETATIARGMRAGAARGG
jgi:hypothetical protein